MPLILTTIMEDGNQYIWCVETNHYWTTICFPFLYKYLYIFPLWITTFNSECQLTDDNDNLFYLKSITLTMTIIHKPI